MAIIFITTIKSLDRILEPLDRILEQLQDTQWHSFDEIKKSICLPSDKLNKLLSFLQKVAFIDKKNEELRITCTGLRFLLL